LNLEVEALELVLLDQLVEVDGHQLEGDALVVAKVKVVQHVDDVVHPAKNNTFFGGIFMQVK
jgi:hypothetical protein